MACHDIGVIFPFDVPEGDPEFLVESLLHHLAWHGAGEYLVETDLAVLFASAHEVEKIVHYRHKHLNIKVPSDAPIPERQLVMVLAKEVEKPRVDVLPPHTLCRKVFLKHAVLPLKENIIDEDTEHVIAGIVETVPENRHGSQHRRLPVVPLVAADRDIRGSGTDIDGPDDNAVPRFAVNHAPFAIDIEKVL